jgi:hypothetical protein
MDQSMTPSCVLLPKGYAALEPGEVRKVTPRKNVALDPDLLLLDNALPPSIGGGAGRRGRCPSGGRPPSPKALNSRGFLAMWEPSSSLGDVHLP